MPHVVDATYEDGVLKPDRPLPLKDRAKVRVTVESLVDTAVSEEAVRRNFGLIAWPGAADILERLALDPEFDVLESP